MQLFTKSNVICIGGVDVEVKEIGIGYLLLDDKEKEDTKKLLELHTSLTKEEINRLTVDAFQTILDAFYEINNEHFALTSEEKETDIKK